MPFPQENCEFQYPIDLKQRQDQLFPPEHFFHGIGAFVTRGIWGYNLYRKRETAATARVQLPSDVITPRESSIYVRCS